LIVNDPLVKIFTPDVMKTLSGVALPSEALKTRLAVLAAADYEPDQFGLSVMKNAWRGHLQVAFDCGLLDDGHGNDLRARLTGIDDNNFMSAISECLTAWFLSRTLALQIKPRPTGRSGKVLEFAIVLPDGDIRVEVKAPHRPIPTRVAPQWGDESEMLKSVIFAANRQFKAGDRNLLVIVPGWSVVWCVPDKLRRIILLKALFGESVIQVPIDPRTGGPVGPTTTGFRASGEFLKTWNSKPGEGEAKSVRFTRIGGVLLINQTVADAHVDLSALMVHNPHAQVPLPRDTWNTVSQFADENGLWSWQDP
jgi:hypothetical protein